MPRAPKAPIPLALRWEVWERDGYRCHYCNSGGPLTIDHKIPESQGGPTVLENLVSACPRCNTRKATLPYNVYKTGLHFDRCDLHLINRRRRGRGRLARSSTWRREWVDRIKQAIAEDTHKRWADFMLFYSSNVYLSIEARVIRQAETRHAMAGDYLYDALRVRWIIRHCRWCFRVQAKFIAVEILFGCVQGAFGVFLDNLESLHTISGDVAQAFERVRGDKAKHFGRLYDAMDDWTTERRLKSEAVDSLI